MSSEIPRTLFSTHPLKVSQRYESFLESMGVVFQVSNPQCENREFYGKIESLLFGEMMLVDCETRAQAFLRSKQMIAKDSLDHFLFQFFLGGATWDKESEAFASSKGQELLVLDTSQTWNALTNDFRNITLVIPRRLIAHRLNEENSHHKKVFGAENPFAKLLRDHLLNLKASVNQLRTSDVPATNQITLDLVVALLNRNSDQSKTDSPQTQKAQNYLLKMKIKSYLEKNLHDPLISTEKISQVFRISRSHLYNIFDCEGGVARFIRKRRLTLAYKRLIFSEDNIPIADISRSVGYKNLSSFSRSFNREFHVCPTELKSKNGRFSPYPTDQHSLASKEWERWIADL